MSRSEFLRPASRHMCSLVAVAHIVELDWDGIISTLVVSRKLGGNDQLVSDNTLLPPSADKLL